jgi:hypothetical protein
MWLKPATACSRFSHLPGHSPGSIALWEPASRSLFAGDAIYHGVVVDSGPGADVPTYAKTMNRLRALPVREVFGGHNARMSRARAPTSVLPCNSSPAAIYKSLERRRKRLEERLREEEALHPFGPQPLRPHELPAFDPDDIDEATGEEAEAAEEEILDEVTAALDLNELRAEIDHLKVLEDQAFRLKQSGQDTKWRELLSILDDPIIRDPVSGLRRKIIIFTEPRDTLEYLQQKIAATVGADGVVVIHGGIAREARRAAIAAFNSGLKRAAVRRSRPQRGPYDSTRRAPREWPAGRPRIATSSRVLTATARRA